MLKIFKIISLILLLTGAVSAGLPGTLDTTFGGTGIVYTTFPPYTVYGYDIAVQPDGKIVIAGSVPDAGWMIARLNPDGSLDTTFGSGGKVFTHVGTNQSYCNSVALQPDGKIVLAGSAYINFFASYIAVARFNTNGSLDPTFGSGGISLREHNGNYSTQDVAVTPNGNIFLAAAPGTHIGVPFATLYNSSGSGGWQVGIGGNGTFFSGVASQADGKVLIAGGGWTIWRLTESGGFDGTFNVPVGASSPYVYEVLARPDGKILSIGVATVSTQDVALVQLNTDGSLDTTFDGDGKVLIDVTGAGDVGTDLALQADGKIIALGVSGSTFEVIRLRPNGALDPVFAGDGIATVDVPNFYPVGVAIQPDGKIVALGYSYENGFVTVRLNGGNTAPFDFDGDGKTDISIFRPSNGQWWLNRSTAGVYAASFGNSSDHITPGDFTGDGKTDLAFWRPSPSAWFVFRSDDHTYYSFPYGLNGDVPTVGDFDGDNLEDPAIFRPSNGRWYTRRSTDGVVAMQVFGVNGDVPVPADYDGDGKTDIAIFRPSNGQWWIQRSTAGAIAYTFGNSSDKPVPGDYTEDGKSDVAFWRPSTGEWFILRSENNSFYSFPFGISTDMAAPGDYDGDGKFDAAIFRSSNARWYVNRSTAGTLIQTFGQNGDRPVPNAFVP